ncbi:MAG: response regulator [Acidobacteriaceae bacterium]|nr:response regulator [Acidobacteriaceae bacterium]MBV9497938.1 response regulator [Acidobacteriaceae bacterium]
MVDDAKKILIVEDNLADVRLIEEAFHAQRIAIEIEHYETASAGVRAISRYGSISQSVPDLILLDYNLPGGYARDVLQAINENPALANVPRAVITCSIAPKDRERALLSGAHLFIFKPANLDDFLNEVGMALAGLLNVRSEITS